jgi:hypothetical protein
MFQQLVGAGKAERVAALVRQARKSTPRVQGSTLTRQIQVPTYPLRDAIPLATM